MHTPQLVHVDVELDGTHTRGQTVVDFGHAADSGSRDRTVRWVRAARDHGEITARLDEESAHDAEYGLR